MSREEQKEARLLFLQENPRTLEQRGKEVIAKSIESLALRIHRGCVPGFSGAWGIMFMLGAQLEEQVGKHEGGPD